MRRSNGWQHSFQGMKRIKLEEKATLDFTPGSSGAEMLVGRGPIGLLRWWKAAKKSRE